MPFINHVPNIDFLGQRRKAAIFSITWWLISMALIFIRGPSWGIDFTGGSEIRLKFEQGVTTEEVRSSVGAAGLEPESVQEIGEAGSGEFVIRIQDPTFGSERVTHDVNEALSAHFGKDWISESRFDAEVGTRMTVHYKGDPVKIEDINASLSNIEGAKATKSSDDNTFMVTLPSLSTAVQETLQSSISKPFKVLQVEAVGPSVGKELRNQGFLAVAITCALILVYVGFRFEFAFAPGAIIAVLHDIINVVGVFIVLEMLGYLHNEFNLNIVGALLTILGYSLADTVIIYDRIRENQKRFRRKPLGEIMNLSVNETLGRTLGTSMTVILSMIPFLFLGGQVFETFALAIILGVIFGTYSTVYVASPLTMVFEDLQPTLERLVGLGQSVVGGKDANLEGLTESERRRRERESRLAERKGKDHP